MAKILCNEDGISQGERWFLIYKYIVQGFAWGIHGIIYICHNYMTAADKKNIKNGHIICARTENGTESPVIIFWTVWH